MRLFYDLHIHSCLSPCADNDMTPGNIAGMAHLAGLDAVALTDHNTCGHTRLFCRAAASFGLVALAGMELTTAEEVHVVCLFADIDAAGAFSEHVYARLPDIPNRPDIFGEQIYVDERDEPVGTEPRLLISATGIGTYDAAALAARFGGVAFPAHIDRPAFSLLSNLGLWDGAMGFRFAERTKTARVEGLPEIPYLINSDAHRLCDIPDAAHTLEVSARSSQAVLDALKKMC